MEEEEWLWILASVRCCLIVSEHLHPFIIMMMIWSVHFAPFCCLILYSFYFFNKMLPTLSITHIRNSTNQTLLLCLLTSSTLLSFLYASWSAQLLILMANDDDVVGNEKMVRKRKLKLNEKTFKNLFSKEGNSRKY